MNATKDLECKLDHTKECLDMEGINAVVQRHETAGVLSDS